MVNQFRLAACTAALNASILLLVTSCGGGDPQNLTFEVSIHERSVDETSSVLVAKQDDKVTIVVSSDELLNFHLHGYDIKKEVKPEEATTIHFIAKATGSFPFTIHTSEEKHDEEEEHKEQSVTEKKEDSGVEGEQSKDNHQENSDHDEREEIPIGRLEVQPR